jgi:hypothetical protein
LVSNIDFKVGANWRLLSVVKIQMNKEKEKENKGKI